jgi:hypothetical protein
MSPGDINVGINSMLVCVEMIIFAILHIFAFSYKPYATNQYGPVPRSSVWRSFANVFNPWDTIKAIARSFKWILCGIKKRHEEAAIVKKRKESKIIPGQHPDEDEEGWGLVQNAGAMGESGNAYGMEATDVHRPASSTEYQGYAQQPISMHPQTSVHDRPAPYGDPSDLGGYSPHFGPTHLDDRDHEYLMPAATTIPPVQPPPSSSSALPYPADDVHGMPSMRHPLPEEGEGMDTPYSDSDAPRPAYRAGAGNGVTGYRHQDLLGGSSEPTGGGGGDYNPASHDRRDEMHF